MTQTKTEVAVMRAGECRWPEGRWDPRVQVKVSSQDSAGAYSVCEIAVPPRTGPPMHLHRFEDEWFYVLEGDFRFVIGGEEIAAPEGTSLFGPRRIAHTFQNVGSSQGRLLTVSTPG